MKYRKNKSVKLSKNYKSTELDCNGVNCCSITLIDSELITLLQKIRNYFGKPVIINSGYRCAIHNKRVGGASSSRHTKGQAADIRIKGVSAIEIATYCESIGIKGIGLYDNFVHIDTRTKKAFWRGHNQLPCLSFGGTLRKVAKDVIDGKYGTGASRKRKLRAAGYDYKEVQALVNELLRK